MSYYPPQSGVDINRLAQDLVNALDERARYRDPLVLETIQDLDYNDFRNPEFEKLLDTTESYLEFLLSERRDIREAMPKAISFGIDLTTSALVAKRGVRMPRDIEIRMSEVFDVAEQTKRMKQQQRQPAPSYGSYGQAPHGSGLMDNGQYQQPAYSHQGSYRDSYQAPPVSQPAYTPQATSAPQETTVRTIERDENGNIVKTQSRAEEQYQAPANTPRVFTRDDPARQTQEPTPNPEIKYAERIGNDMDYEDHKKLAMDSMQVSETKADKMAKFMGDLEQKSRYEVDGGLRTRNYNDKPEDGDSTMAEHTTYDTTLYAFDINEATVQVRAELSEIDETDTAALSFTYISTTALCSYDDIQTAKLAMANAKVNEKLAKLDTLEDFVELYQSKVKEPLMGKVLRFINLKATQLVNKYIAHVLNEPDVYVDSVGDDYNDLNNWFSENYEGISRISRAAMKTSKAIILTGEDQDGDDEVSFVDRCVSAGLYNAVLRLNVTPEFYHLTMPSSRTTVSREFHPELVSMIESHIDYSRAHEGNIYTNYIIFDDMMAVEIYPTANEDEYRLVPV